MCLNVTFTDNWQRLRNSKTTNGNMSTIYYAEINFLTKNRMQDLEILNVFITEDCCEV